MVRSRCLQTRAKTTINCSSAFAPSSGHPLIPILVAVNRISSFSFFFFFVFFCFAATIFHTPFGVRLPRRRHFAKKLLHPYAAPFPFCCSYHTLQPPHAPRLTYIHLHPLFVFSPLNLFFDDFRPFDCHRVSTIFMTFWRARGALCGSLFFFWRSTPFHNRAKTSLFFPLIFFLVSLPFFFLFCVHSYKFISLTCQLPRFLDLTPCPPPARNNVRTPLCQPPWSRANAVVNAKDAWGVGEGSRKIRDLFQIKRVNSVKKLFRCSFGIIFHSLGREDNFIWRIVVGGGECQTANRCVLFFFRLLSASTSLPPH